MTPFHSLFALILGLLAIFASTMHLGRPLYAWRAFVGLKSSWLSREIIVFGLFAGCAVLYAGALWFPAIDRFVNVPLRQELSNPYRNELYPFLLLTGRGTSSQWHTQTRTGKSAVLRKLYPDGVYVEMNSQDAESLSIETNHKALIASRRGEIIATVFVTNTVQPGQLFIPMHYALTNELTYPSFDPYSRQPWYKACAVAVKPLR